MNNKEGNQTSIVFTKTFLKQYKKAPKKVQKSFKQRLRLYVQNPGHVGLRRHQLSGKFAAYTSINITGDWRLILKEEKNSITCMLLGTHSQLYG